MIVKTINRFICLSGTFFKKKSQLLLEPTREEHEKYSPIFSGGALKSTKLGGRKHICSLLLTFYHLNQKMQHAALELRTPLLAHTPNRETKP